MANVRIEKLDIILTMPDEGEAAFARLFQQYMSRWKQQTEMAERLRCEAEHERTGIGGNGGRR
jgi:hypothetical protein